MIDTSKNRNRAAPSFANINLLGRCNANCYFCLGKDIEDELSKHNQIKVHYEDWANFEEFVSKCEEQGIPNIYITGQNVDSLQYHYISELIPFLQNHGFSVGLRTNGYLAKQKIREVNLCDASVGYSIHSLIPDVNRKILGHHKIPDWDYILNNTNNYRISVVLNRYNQYELLSLLQFFAQYDPNYVQIRRICTDVRFDELTEDMEVYERVYQWVKEFYPKVAEFYTADVFRMFGLDVNFWRTTQITVNSFNYFTDGTISEEYFVVEGYMKQNQKPFT